MEIKGRNYTTPSFFKTYLKRVVQFEIKFADITLPAAPGGRDGIPSILMQSSYSKKTSYNLYVNICEEGQRYVK